jgi:hypothetical protein
MKKSAVNKLPAHVVARHRFNLTYITMGTDRKVREGSGRSKVYDFVAAAGAKGANRERIEKHFEADGSVNIKASLDYLLKVGMMTTIPARRLDV